MADSPERYTDEKTESAGGGTNGETPLADGGSHEHNHGDESTHEHGHAHDHDDGGEHEHRHSGMSTADIGVGVVTVSSTRTLKDDASGDAVVAACEAAGASVETRELLPDDRDRIRDTVATVAEAPAVDAVITTGGTGVTPDDVTVEAVRALFGRELPGFGELFRRYSETEIGTRVVATRATAGVVDGVPVFCLPGSENAAELGTEEIVVPELAHLVGLASEGAHRSEENGSPPE